MEQNGLDDDANLPAGWLATMQLVWEQAANTNNMVHRCVQFAHVFAVFALLLIPLLTFVFAGRTFRGGKIAREDRLLGCCCRGHLQQPLRLAHKWSATLCRVI